MSQFEEDVSTKMEKELVITPDGEEVKTEEKEDDYKISDKATGKVDEILQQDAEDDEGDGDQGEAVGDQVAEDDDH